MGFTVGERVNFAGIASVVREIGERSGEPAYLIENGPDRIPMWVPESVLDAHQEVGRPTAEFTSHLPALLSVDDFFRDPDEVRAIALTQEYRADARYYKGLRSTQRFLWPFLREEFGRLLGSEVTVWLEHNANGCFQQTKSEDPLVWHHDDQQYAAAVYLNPGADARGGTSFWRDKTMGTRRRPTHPLEQARLGSPEAVKAAQEIVYDPYNFVHPDNWELVESVAGLYNRLVIWDAALIHSATSYETFKGKGPTPTRLVQLFFFDL